MPKCERIHMHKPNAIRLYDLNKFCTSNGIALYSHLLKPSRLKVTDKNEEKKKNSVSFAYLISLYSFMFVSTFTGCRAIQMRKK